MNGKKNRVTILFVLSVSLLTASLITVLLTYYYCNVQFQLLDGFCREIITEYPDSKQPVLEILKSKKMYSAESAEESFLRSFGYKPTDFWNLNGQIFVLAGAAFLSGGALFLFAFVYWHKKSAARIEGLTKYLEKVNTGSQGLLLDAEEDEFSRLQDEIYKTITTLYQTRDTALREKSNYADNLSNIAHQLKTPITAISLSVQMMKEHPSADYSGQIMRGLNRLTHLEEALLLLSRIDAGTLVMKRETTDVFTLLTLASDNLQELFIRKGVSVEIPEAGEIAIIADLDWTMEAIMNLMKNCMEHTEAGTCVHCSYEKNPLYVQIRIWDEGRGFAGEELPHLFERFYRGKNADTRGDAVESGNVSVNGNTSTNGNTSADGSAAVSGNASANGNTTAGGIGIGLSLAKAIIEMQNGIIRAFNLYEGGACFEIRFYSH